MAAKLKFNSEFQQDKPGEARSAGPDGVDAMVESFLAELTDISSETQQGDAPAGVEAAIKPIEMTWLPESDVEVPSESNDDLERINSEVEERLIELESLKSGKIAIAEQKDSRSVPPPPPEKPLSLLLELSLEL